MKENAFKLLHIALIESVFKRSDDKSIMTDNFRHSIDISNNHTLDDNILTVIVTLTFKRTVKGKVVISAKIKMLGYFEVGKNAHISLKDFAGINAPAIIFPFIREHLANISIKAMISPILLPPINFVALAEEKKKE